MDAKPIQPRIMLILKNALLDWRWIKIVKNPRLFLRSVALLECRNNSDSKLASRVSFDLRGMA